MPCSAQPCRAGASPVRPHVEHGLALQREGVARLARSFVADGASAPAGQASPGDRRCTPWTAINQEGAGASLSSPRCRSSARPLRRVFCWVSVRRFGHRCCCHCRSADCSQRSAPRCGGVVGRCALWVWRWPASAGLACMPAGCWPHSCRSPGRGVTSPSPERLPTCRSMTCAARASSCWWMAMTPIPICRGGVCSCRGTTISAPYRLARACSCMQGSVGRCGCGCGCRAGCPIRVASMPSAMHLHSGSVPPVWCVRRTLRVCLRRLQGWPRGGSAWQRVSRRRCLLHRRAMCRRWPWGIRAASPMKTGTCCGQPG
ncbi:hypothetical protein D3C81_852680 [compost metagenome]